MPNKYKKILVKALDQFEKGLISTPGPDGNMDTVSNDAIRKMNRDIQKEIMGK